VKHFYAPGETLVKHFEVFFETFRNEYKEQIFVMCWFLEFLNKKERFRN